MESVQSDKIAPRPVHGWSKAAFLSRGDDHEDGEIKEKEKRKREKNRKEEKRKTEPRHVADGGGKSSKRKTSKGDVTATRRSPPRAARR